jgi:hypothetical protein
MGKTQQEIVNLYRQLLPQIKEESGKLEISLRGTSFTIPIQATQTVVKGRTTNKSYRNC